MYGGILTLLQKLKVKNIIISKQKEESGNLKEFLKIIENTDSNIILVEAGKRIDIEEDIYIDILWPTKNLEISENALNNNSIVAKINYNNFSILLTGDIEEKAEKEILKKYKSNESILKSTILKVAHHGSKSSSSKEFLEKVRPDIAIIGVGKNNKFGHPNKEAISNILTYASKIYRTDEDGEIKIKTDGIRITKIDKKRDI